MSTATVAPPINFQKWVDENRHLLKPPVGNKCIWENEDFIVMVVGGPNKRKDYHVNETSEFFYQIQGDITVGIIDPQTRKPRDVIIREGETFLLPPLVPHSPRRPADTVGIVVETGRKPGAKDKLQWYCDKCGGLVYEAEFKLQNIAVDLKRIMEEFWSKDDLRRCKRDGSVIAPPGEAQPPPN
ncbi:MAG: 3-hydroxyanthranilate 3,4-dioxygenase [Phycisphaerae bacterium]|jgi:3-hydroxyanthranilate 3,4-dioxygenase|nr:3-hydroxyanthranilate 3,4-dioxygenase [Phycisphaerae bacterium]MCZ2398576.1 3-hydroxyanthranilate 3,4-dioxygenase [Phycisphaerae bacterium]NUQ49731.1 3-hydroxyanthranilate 3,4-dioxygenase [Phycisphaerae bacterium]